MNPFRSWTALYIRRLWPYFRLESILRLRRLSIYTASNPQQTNDHISLGIKRPYPGYLTIRAFGTDLDTCEEVFIHRVYAVLLEHLEECRTIIDLGANIGLTSLYLAANYPKSTILSVEPDSINFSLLCTNLKALIDYGRCKTLQAAVWNSARSLFIPATETGDYNAVHVREVVPADASGTRVAGMRIADIIECSGFSEIDILKVDIEGAEVEMLQGDLEWLRSVRTIAIEFHDNSRIESQFDAKMKMYGFCVLDTSTHTVLAFRKGS